MTDSKKNTIALLTDFGPLGGHYVASMKGVILKINPNVKIIDISHNISSFSIIEASYVIKTTYKYFPENTVFIIVVDPGVGSSRKILAIKTKTNYFFVGPDNGIFLNALSMDEISECVIVDNDNYFIKPVSKTFHGRDIMAPVGAHILNGIHLNDFGPPFEPINFTKYPIEYKVLPEKKVIQCTIMYVDNFGNGITNIAIEKNFIKGTSLSLKENMVIALEFKNQKYEGKFISHFASASLNSLVFLKGSTNYLEISINQGNASKGIGFKSGDIITIKL
jgi:hypothetical protein